MSKNPLNTDKKSKFDENSISPGCEKAYCIRCGAITKKYSIDKPFCEICIALLNENENNYFTGKYCHACGKIINNRETYYGKPICSDCFYQLYK